jgi:hypothetical protein
MEGLMDDGDRHWRPRQSDAGEHSGRLVKLEPVVGAGGPGTVYSASGFTAAVAKHGRPFGVFDRDRLLNYRAR